MIFRDIPTNVWFARFVASVIRGHLASGYKNAQGNYTGLFLPGNNITYAEAAKMMLNLAGIAAGGGAPANRTAIGDWSALYINAMEKMHSSVYPASVDVRTPIARGPFLQAVMETLGLAPSGNAPNPYTDVPSFDTYAPAILTATQKGIVRGDSGKQTFRPRDNINRAEAAKILVRFAEGKCM